MDTFLREQRARREIRSADLARELGVHPMSILRWERRERLPGPAHIHALAAALDVEPTRVVGFFDAARPAPTGAHGLRGHGLRRLRWALGLPATTVADHLGVGASTVYNWESGRARIPADVLEPLAALLGTGVPSLVDELASAPAVPLRRVPAPTPLRRLRARSGLSQERAARGAGVHRHSLGAWERGEGRPPLAVVRRLAAAYGVAVADVARAARIDPPALLDQRRWRPGDLPAVLRTLRAWAGLSQADLARRCGCSVSTVRAWESGRSEPCPRLRRRLEQALGLADDALATTLRP